MLVQNTKQHIIHPPQKVHFLRRGGNSEIVFSQIMSEFFWERKGGGTYCTRLAIYATDS